MKKILFVLILLICTFVQTKSFANVDTVSLIPDEIVKINVPQTQNLSDLNKREEDIEDYAGFYSDEDVFESKAGKAFSKIIEHTVINNKINNYANNITNYQK